MNAPLNPTPWQLARRAALSEAATQLNLPLIEDKPYGDLWFDTPPSLPLTARNPEGSIYLGSFSKVLAPGLRLGFIVAALATAIQIYAATALQHEGESALAG